MNQKPRIRRSTANWVYAQVAYRNPWWADPRDPTKDRRLVECAVSAERVLRGRPSRIWAAWAVGVSLLAATVGLWVWTFGNVDDHDVGGVAIVAVLLTLVLLVYVPLASWIVDWPARPVNADLASLANRSWSDYQTWLAALATSDPSLHAQIRQWHQGERMVAAQQATQRAVALTGLAVMWNSQRHR